MSKMQHPDDLAVDRFAAAMKAKLAKKRAEGRGGWDDPQECHVVVLARMLLEHIRKGDPVDIANFAMMMHQRGAEAYLLWDRIVVDGEMTDRACRSRYSAFDNWSEDLRAEERIKMSAALSAAFHGRA